MLVWYGFEKQCRSEGCYLNNTEIAIYVVSANRLFEELENLHSERNFIYIYIQADEDSL